MNFMDWPWIKGLSELLATRRPEPMQQAERIVAMQLHIVLPAKAGVIGVMFYYLFYVVSPYEVTNTRGVANETLQKYFLVYVLCNVLAGVVFVLWRRFAARSLSMAALHAGAAGRPLHGGSDVRHRRI